MVNLTPAEVLEESKHRLDALLPEGDAAVFKSNAGMETSGWEKAFVEALAIAYKSTDALASEIASHEADKADLVRLEKALDACGSRVTDAVMKAYNASLAAEKKP